LSVFDLDHTLLKCSISYRFFHHLFSARVYKFKNLFQAFALGVRYKLGTVSAQDVHQECGALFLESTSASEIIRHFSSFLAGFNPKMINQKVFDLLAHAKRNGHYTLLATSSPEFIVRPLLRYFPVDELLASDYRVNNVCDRFECQRAIDGALKRDYSLSLSEKFNLPKHALYAYSDSITDLPLLECVGHPVVVCPDRKLKKIARERRWERI